MRGSGVTSRGSLLILHTQAESGAYGFLPPATASFNDVNRNRISPEFIGSQLRTDCVYRQEFDGTIPLVFKVVGVRSAAFSGITMDDLLRLIFPTFMVVQWTCWIQAVPRAYHHSVVGKSWQAATFISVSEALHENDLHVNQGIY